MNFNGRHLFKFPALVLVLVSSLGFNRGINADSGGGPEIGTALMAVGIAHVAASSMLTLPVYGIGSMAIDDNEKEGIFSTFTGVALGSLVGAFALGLPTGDPGAGAMGYVGGGFIGGVIGFKSSIVKMPCRCGLSRRPGESSDLSFRVAVNRENFAGVVSYKL